jgi:tetratricopeptide (TPR) repeat protein
MTLALVLADFSDASAQVYRRENRRGNRALAAGDYDGAIRHYEKALSRDTSKVAPLKYNMAYTFHSDRRDSTQNMIKDTLAMKYMDEISDKVVGTELEYDYHFTTGVIAIDMKDWKRAVDEFKKCMILRPDDLKAKENYIYAKEHLKNDNGGGSGQDQQQDQQDQQQDKNDQQQDKNDQQQQDQQQDQQKDQDQQQQDQDQQNQQQNAEMSAQTAKQLLQAVQAMDKETQEKVEKKKAAVMGTKQKGKNW